MLKSFTEQELIAETLYHC